MRQRLSRFTSANMRKPMNKESPTASYTGLQRAHHSFTLGAPPLARSRTRGVRMSANSSIKGTLPARQSLRLARCASSRYGGGCFPSSTSPGFWVLRARLQWLFAALGSCSGQDSAFPLWWFRIWEARIRAVLDPRQILEFLKILVFTSSSITYRSVLASVSEHD
jgi:hypothetical protein